MSSAFAETPIGRLVNSLSNGRLLQSADQKPGFVLPPALYEKVYGHADPNQSADTTRKPSLASIQAKGAEEQETLETSEQVERAASKVLPEGQDLNKIESLSRGDLTRQISKQAQDAKAASKDDVIIVDWYGPNDPENPKNWSFHRKVLVTAAINILTFNVYSGSSIITPSTEGVMHEFGVSQTKAIMSLSVFVMGYAIGPLLLGPPSDVPKIGRSHPYWFSMLLLVLFNIGAAESKSYGTLIAMRLLSGMAGSPALATGGATLGDVWEALALPKAISIWAAGAVAGPVFGPVIAGFAAQNVGWRLPYWLFVAMSGLGLIVTLVMLPETLPDNILYRRAKRLRKLTGDQRLRSQGEVKQAAMKPLQFAKHALWMPIRISLEPIVLYTSVLLGLIYAIFYAAFEATPIIFMENHGMSLGQSQLIFLGLGVNCFFITLPIYIAYLVYWFDPRFIRNLQKGKINPEDRIILAMITAPLVPITLFWIGWSSAPSVSYWAPLVGLSVYLTPIYYLFQAILTYLAFAYAEHQASVMAANDLIRSLIAASFPIFSTAMFRNLGLGKAYSTLAGISVALLLPLFALYFVGHKLRKISKYAHDYDKDFEQPDGTLSATESAAGEKQEA